jgi:nucleoside-diphosphate-sugar epimerase
MTGKTILVTGASGFTGRHFIAAAKQAGYRCVALRHHAHENVSQADQCITANLLDLESLNTAVAQAKPDKIVHLAAVSFVAHDDTAEIYQTNLIGTLNLLNAIKSQAPGVEKILVASSANIYGNATTLPITEDTPPQPVNHYGVSKFAMERAVALFDTLPVVIVRPFNYTGAGQHNSFLVPKIVNAFSKNESKIELGNLDVSRDFSDVRDVVSAYLKLLASEDTLPIYNICTGHATSLQEIIAILNTLAGYEIEVTTNPVFVRADEIKTLYGSPQRLESTIGSYRKHTINDTLAWMLQCKHQGPS